MAMLIGFILPTTKTLVDALIQYIMQSYEKEEEPKIKRNIKYAYNRLLHSYPVGERKYACFQEELNCLTVLNIKAIYRNIRVTQLLFF